MKSKTLHGITIQTTRVSDTSQKLTKMLHEFLADNQTELIARCRAKVAVRSGPQEREDELEHGIPIFLGQLIDTLQIEQGSYPMLSRRISGPSNGAPGPSEMGDTAAIHGRHLLRRGFTVEEVVHDYGDLCQAITDLAFERDEPIETDEFRTLNRCLDNGIAVAVSEFNSQYNFAAADEQAVAVNERLGFLAHELRNHLNTAMMALIAIKAGNVGLAGATGAILDRSLVGIRNLIDSSLSDVRLTAGMPVQNEVFSLADFINEVRLTASLEAQVKGCVFIAAGVDSQLFVDADRGMLLSAVGNLLQNAFKFTRRHTEVVLRAHRIADRIIIEIEDHCGGLPAGDAEKMFLPFTQGGEDRTGMGLGLSIARRGVEASGGILSVRDKSLSGCVFTIDLPGKTEPLTDYETNDARLAIA